jgi:hypothetical protein
MKSLENQLITEPSQYSPKLVALHGLGGFGKTQLALKYAFDKRQEYGFITWFDASSTETIEDRFKAPIKKYMNVPKLKQVSVEDFIMWLGKRRREWLLIFDNADGPDLRIIKNYFAGVQKGNILITTKQRDLRRLSSSAGIWVEAMEESEAVELLLSCAEISEPGVPQQREAIKIANTLGRLPLAMDLAGAFIANSPSISCDLKKYLPEFEKKRLHILNKTPAEYFGDYDLSVLTTWESSFEAISIKNLSAGNLLTLYGFLDRTYIFPMLFEAAATLSKIIYKHHPDSTDHIYGKLGGDLLQVSDDIECERTAYDEAVAKLASYHLVRY